eukprot:2378173-Pleurochrysis_carterae.AAC.1
MAAFDVRHPPLGVQQRLGLRLANSLRARAWPHETRSSCCAVFKSLRSSCRTGRVENVPTPAMHGGVMMRAAQEQGGAVKLCSHCVFRCRRRGSKWRESSIG